jgi:hypothetical protein
MYMPHPQNLQVQTCVRIFEIQNFISCILYSAHPMTTPMDPRFCWCWIGVMTFTKMKSTVLLLQYSHEYMSSNSVYGVAITRVFDCLQTLVRLDQYLCGASSFFHEWATASVSQNLRVTRFYDTTAQVSHNAPYEEA